jgi:pimeloyl-ACP methyl ester carboxylesterase
MGGEVAAALAELNPERIERLIFIDSPPIAEATFTPYGRACWQHCDAAASCRLEPRLEAYP